MKKCPFCSGEIQDEAIKCKFCKKFLNEENNNIKKGNFEIINELHQNKKIEAIEKKNEEKKIINPGKNFIEKLFFSWFFRPKFINLENINKSSGGRFFIIFYLLFFIIISIFISIITFIENPDITDFYILIITFYIFYTVIFSFSLLICLNLKEYILKGVFSKHKINSNNEFKDFILGFFIFFLFGMMLYIMSVLINNFILQNNKDYETSSKYERTSREDRPTRTRINRVRNSD